MARGYAETTAYLAGSRERIENDLDEAKGHTLAAMGAAAEAKKDAAATRAMVERICTSLGISLPEEGEVPAPRLPPMRDRTVSSQDLEAFVDRIEDKIERARDHDRPTPVFAFPVPGMPVVTTDSTTVRRTEMTSERVRGTVSEVLDKIELDEVRKKRDRREKITDGVTEDVSKKAVLTILAFVLAVLGSHILWH